MSVSEKVKIVMASANVSGRQLAETFGSTQGSASTKITRGLKSVSDLVKVLDACGATLTITTKNGIDIPLTLADVKEEQAKNKDK
ncbi:MAG: hypothetical protein IJ516_05550 [Phascolarctobacterium sp.]|nr:hypothetical protein [Phascolarctobacterium sp.]